MIFGMFIARTALLAEIERALARAPAVVLLGPRQVGKTTLARQIEANHEGALYLDLESSADQRRLEDPRAFLGARAGKLTILDEVHRAPYLLAELRGLIDQGRQGAGGQSAPSPSPNGRFLLLGSASLDLVQQAAETLAGRVVYIDVPPLSPEETGNHNIPLDQLWVRGGFPGSLLADDDAASMAWRADFIRSYLQRDVPLFAPRLPASTIGRLWTMLANGQGNIMNAARLGQALGVSAPMIGRYTDLLQDLFLLRRLQPWSGNLDKRLVRAPKLYLTDSGLVHGLLEIPDLHSLLGHPVIGASWEGFVIETLIRAANTAHAPARIPLYYRTHDGAEIDLIFERAGKPEMAFEIKRSSAPSLSQGFHIACDDLKIERRFCVAPVSAPYPAKHGVEVLPLAGAVAMLSA